MTAGAPVPFDGDEVVWIDALRETARRYHAATEPGQPINHAAVAELRLVRERTRHGWFRWEAVASPASSGGAAGLLREAGVLDPTLGITGGWACRAVWGCQPPTFVLSLGIGLLRPVSAARAAAFTVATIAALQPAKSVLPGPPGLIAAALFGIAMAQGVPVGLRQATRHRVRIVADNAAYAPVFFQLLAHEQQLRALARGSGRDELIRAAAMLPRLLWDAAGLVPLAEDDDQARELLLGYEESLAILVDQAVEVDREEAALETAIRHEHPVPVTVAETPALPDGLLPLASLDEAGRELQELRQGLRHARTVLGGGDDNGTNRNATGDGHAR
ncbi:hypothetical protein [Streptomyces sp. XH2]|uniref:hypothetical protein n=1 Tax=Streptomyces sp. XH2 TaxID=3412483 RepID=UPI003C7D3A41